MEFRTKEAKRVFWLGLIGIVSVLVTIISDFILIGKPNSAYGFLLLGTESMWDIPMWRIAVGTFVGVFVLPFQVLGLVSIYYGLKPAGKMIQRSIVGISAHALIMGVAFHMAYALIGS